MKKITILFHIGFGKTATTWMQRQVFPRIKNCLYFGKYSEGDLMLNESFHKLHYQLFRPLHGKNRHRSRNSEDLLRQYAKEISEQILSKFSDESLEYEQVGNYKAILSNETIACYGNHDAELNLMLLSRVASAVKENLGREFDVSVQILVTFREQSSLLQSIYAFDYPHLSDKYQTFSDFIEEGLANHHDEVFGSLWVDEVVKLVRSLFRDDTVLFVPYEILKENPLEFLRQTIVKLGLVTSEQLSDFSDLDQENTNKGKDGANKLRDVSNMSKLIAKVARYKHFAPDFMFNTMKKVATFIRSHQKVVFRGEIKLTPSQRNKIRNLYRESNTRTAKLLSFDLGKLGYSVNDSQSSVMTPEKTVSTNLTASNSSDIAWHNATVTRENRECSKSSSHRSLVIWFTGLSGSGKSTIAHEIEERLFSQGAKTYVLDGDNVRHGLNSDLGFSDQDRKENVRRIAEVTKLFFDAGIITLTAFISPSRSKREEVKSMFSKEDFIEVYCHCPLETCEQRDVKDLYRKAREGLIKDFTGVSVPYEEPLDPDIILNTDVQTLEESVKTVFSVLNERNIFLD
jgi:adenylylsulfate kinase